MSIIQRPGKEGNATTYQGKVAAGYTKILASEVDADIDTMYSAWNAGTDTVNIKDAAVTTPKLAAGAVTGVAIGAGAIQTANLAPGCVTTPIIADGAVTDAKIVALSLSKITPGVKQDGALPLAPRMQVDATATYGDIDLNGPGTPSFDNTKPSWLIRTDYVNDLITIFRSPPPGTAYVALFSVDKLGQLLAGSVGRAALAVNAPNGLPVFAATPPGLVISTANVWTTVATLPSLTTRGGLVHLHANHTLSVTGPVGGGQCNQRWLRDGVQIASWSFSIAQQSGGFAPMPGINFVDNPAAGAHVYTYQALVAPSCTITSSTFGDGSLQAVEIG